MSQSFFEQQRRRWFPPHLNLVPAHITLFHHLPGTQCGDIKLALARHCAGWAPTPFSAAGLRFLGCGVAYDIRAPGLAAYRALLAGLWRHDLTQQDRQGWRPHVTVQNKATPAEARALHNQLLDAFTPFEGVATGIHMWRYLGGPWSSEAVFPFGMSLAQ